MTHLNEADHGRLLACLELASRAGSPGETAAAMAGARRILDRHGLGWLDVLPPAPYPKPAPKAKPLWRETVARCLARRGDLKPWEANFVATLQGFPRLSPKQADCLGAIAERLGLV